MVRKYLMLLLFPFITLSGIAILTHMLGSVKAQKTPAVDPSSAFATDILGSSTEEQEVSTNQGIIMQVISGDARPILLHNFLARYKSPMTPFADLLVVEADKNGFDYRLTTAIAMCESNAGKRMPTKDSFNAYGISVYTGQIYGARFKSWEHSIEWVSRYIKERYHDQGLVALEDMGKRWAPPSVEKGNSWAKCVQTFMDRII